MGQALACSGLVGVAEVAGCDAHGALAGEAVGTDSGVSSEAPELSPCSPAATWPCRSATEPLDTTTPIGTFIFRLLGSRAERERSTITERMTLGRDRAMRAGKWLGGFLPVGYVTDSGRRLIPSDLMTPLGVTEAELARQLFERIAAGSTATAEVRRLIDAGVPSIKRYPNGRALARPRWTVSRVSKIINQDGYWRGAFVVESRYGPVEVPAPPLVTRELWGRAVARLEQNRALHEGRQALLATPRAHRLRQLRTALPRADAGLRQAARLQLRRPDEYRRSTGRRALPRAARVGAVATSGGLGGHPPVHPRSRPGAGGDPGAGARA